MTPPLSLPTVVSDMKETVKFYEEALGCKLRAIFPMHGISQARRVVLFFYRAAERQSDLLLHLQAKHCFLEIGNSAEISFVQLAEGEESEATRDGIGLLLVFLPGPSRVDSHCHCAYGCRRDAPPGFSMRNAAAA